MLKWDRVPRQIRVRSVGWLKRRLEDMTAEDPDAPPLQPQGLGRPGRGGTNAYGVGSACVPPAGCQAGYAVSCPGGEGDPGLLALEAAMAAADDTAGFDVDADPGAAPG